MVDMQFAFGKGAAVQIPLHTESPTVAKAQHQFLDLRRQGLLALLHQVERKEQSGEVGSRPAVPPPLSGLLV